MICLIKICFFGIVTSLESENNLSHTSSNIEQKFTLFDSNRYLLEEAKKQAKLNKNKERLQNNYDIDLSPRIFLELDWRASRNVFVKKILNFISYKIQIDVKDMDKNYIRNVLKISSIIYMYMDTSKESTYMFLAHVLYNTGLFSQLNGNETSMEMIRLRPYQTRGILHIKGKECFEELALICNMVLDEGFLFELEKISLFSIVSNIMYWNTKVLQNTYRNLSFEDTLMILYPHLFESENKSLEYHTRIAYYEMVCEL
jgi:hypothetical protein